MPNKDISIPIDDQDTVAKSINSITLYVDILFSGHTTVTFLKFVFHYFLRVT